MTRVCAAISLAALIFTAASSPSMPLQSTVEVADVHASPRATNAFMRTVLRGGRYEIHNASMLDLIRTAYAVDAEKVVGGPNWLEYDRFEVITKAAPNTPRETLQSMLQGVLADRFKLTVHKETKSIPGHVLTAGKGKPKLKEADPAGPKGCQQQISSLAAAAAGQPSVPMLNVSCHNMTMEAFASDLRRLSGGYLSNDVVDSTALKGAWDFDLKFSLRGLFGSGDAAEVTIFDAVDKQLGLKLEEQKLQTSVIAVDQVNRKPTENPADVDARLPKLPPAEFEVADVKPTEPGARQTGPIMLGFLPGGRVNLPGFPLTLAFSLAWNLPSTENIPGAPKWLGSARFDIIGKAPSEYVPANGGGSSDDLGPMLQGLLKDRFKLKIHFEDQPVTAYTLVAAKPKLKKADPSSRIGCKTDTSGAIFVGAGARVPTRVVTCQNITMAQFVDQLQSIAGTQYFRYPVVDATGLEGAWDFTLTFSAINPTQLAGLRGALPAGQPGGVDTIASEPTGGASIFDAIEKQLGLKLEAQKRSYPVFVIDHIEEKPTDN